jgi:N-methylhydantoinase B/oxoprolinase/acetone carboxylase alpha subunit
VANRAHHADVGGSAPGSLPADAVEVFAEGLRLPPVRFTDEVRALVLANSRTPEERTGDLDAQVGANRVGVDRLTELVAPLLGVAGPGAAGVASDGAATGGESPVVVQVPAFEAVLAYGERRMRAALGELVDGVWRFEDVLDSTGPAAEQQHAAHLEVAVTVDADSIEVDFTGTDAQRRGNVNAVEAVTVSAVAYALRVALDPSLPSNGGVLRPLSIVAPAGTLVNARAPVAVGAGNVEVSQRIAELCLGALAGPCAGRVGAAGQGTMNNLLIGGHGDEAWVYYETVAGGQGGGPTGTGQSGLHTGMTNTRNTPIEALERAYPLRVLRQRLRRGSGGVGSSPGGEGIERDLQVLEDVTVSLITERRVSQPWGLAGGEPGAVGENWLLPGGDESRVERLSDKCTIQLKAGDVLRMLTPGGGGWGRA